MRVMAETHSAEMKEQERRLRESNELTIGDGLKLPMHLIDTSFDRFNVLES